jgi:hypothetical protein
MTLGIALLLLLLLSAAALAMDDSEKVTVYVYRYKQFAGSGLEPSVFADGVQLARMDNGRYFLVKVAPGKHTFTSNDKQAGIEFDAKPGQSYYVRVDIAAGFMKGHGRLTMVAAEQGEYEVKKLKPLDANKVVDKTMVQLPGAEAAAQPGKD